MARANPFEAAEYLDSPAMIAAYLSEALSSEDAATLGMAVGAVVRALQGPGIVCSTADSPSQTEEGRSPTQGE